MRITKFFTAVIVSIVCAAPMAVAVSPATVVQGKQLFERSWPSGNPALGGDGLGPLFNAKSCVACHHLGGVGGAGDSRFNANTIGIESMRIAGGPVTSDVVARLLRSFHPGFVQPDGSMKNTLPVAHHGGSDQFRAARATIFKQLNSQFSEEGGSFEAAEVRLMNATPVLFSNRVGEHEISLRARLFQRNTPALFGIGVIDQVSGRDIEAQAKLQNQHTEISGRPGTLRDGRYGKFGWRGNIASVLDFVDQACAAELGLETRRKQQPRDDMNPEYRNPTTDISDNQIRAMRDFINALPAPTQALPTDSNELAYVHRGRQAFASVGCAVCHVQNMGPARGLYSDLLLHDMGSESIDLSHADPYIIRATPVSEKQTISETGGSPVSQGSSSSYGGGSSSISVSSLPGASISSSPGSPAPPSGSRGRELKFRGHEFHFQAPTQPRQRIELVKLGSQQSADVLEDESGAKKVRKTMVTSFVRLQFQPTNFNQEWRTPPLWGLSDSAPYMHDGRADTILEAIAMHEGEAAPTRDRFLQLPLADRQAIVAFLNTLAAPPDAPLAAN